MSSPSRKWFRPAEFCFVAARGRNIACLPRRRRDPRSGSVAERNIKAGFLGRRGWNKPGLRAAGAGRGVMPRIALYPGSFDPVTNGHLDVVRHAVGPLRPADRRHRGPSRQKAAVFDRGAAGDGPLGVRPGRRRARCAFDCTTYDNLTVTAAHKAGATIMIRGLRDGTDLDYEMQIAGMNETMAPGRAYGVPSGFAGGPPDHRHTGAPDRCMGGDVSAFVPPAVAEASRPNSPVE